MRYFNKTFSLCSARANAPDLIPAHTVRGPDGNRSPGSIASIGALFARIRPPGDRKVAELPH